MSDERDSLVGGDCDHDDLLQLRSYDRSARKAVLRVCRQRGCVSSSPKASMSSTVLPPEKRNPPPNLQRCNFSAKSCLRPPSVHSVSLCLLGSRNDMCCSMVFCCSRMMCCALSLRRIDRAEMLWPSSGRDGTGERAPVEGLTRSNAARISRRYNPRSRP